MRFSDDKLSEFYAEFKQHVEKYEEKIKSDNSKFEALIEAQRQNTAQIALLIDETRDLIELKRDIQGATRLGTSLQRFGLWLTKWGVIGLGLAAAYDWLAKHIVEWFK